MKILILGGSGIQGSASAWDLLQMQPDAQIILADTDEEALEKKARWLGSSRVATRVVDARDKTQLSRLITQQDCQLVISSVPWTVTLPPVEAAIDAGVHFIDYGLYQNREFDKRLSEFDEKAREAQVTIIPSCGVAPGLTNMLAAYGAAQLDRVNKVHIYVGGIPEKPTPPLDYKAVWSLEGVWTQFFEECRIVQDGEFTTVDAGSGLEKLQFEDIGELEAAFTDGLGTLLHMYKDPVFEGVEEVFEKTIRYPGHYDKVMLLKDCGLLDTEPVTVDGKEVSPRAVLTALLDDKLRLDKEERDMTVLRVRVSGTQDGKTRSHIYDMVDYRDLDSGILSMGRTTGYTGSILAPLVCEGKIGHRGVVMPEKLGAERDLFEKMLDEYAKRDITIKSKTQ